MISVIIPIYNSEKTIQKCLESVYRSECRLFEVIAVDDGSTDSSLEIVRKFPVQIIKLERHLSCAVARNRGAQKAKGEILLFVDSDILLEPGTINKVIETFAQRPDIWATFGCYSKESLDSNFFSVYKNLLNYYTHQASSGDAGSFWTACGAVKREVFERLGGFAEEAGYSPIEDVAFGYKISKHGGKIYLNKQLQIRHLKSYTFLSLIKTDFIRRALPWTKIILRERHLKRELILKSNNIVSGGLASVILLALLSPDGFFNSWFVSALLALLFLLNGRFYWFTFREKGLTFALRVIPMHFLFYLYSVVGFFVGAVSYLWNYFIAGKIGKQA